MSLPRIALAPIAVALLLAGDAAACRTDRDCAAASRCVLVWGQIEGTCVRGVSPIPAQESVRIGDENAPRAGEGQPCEFTVDCQRGLTCSMQPDTSVRVCRR
jgi:hypothetical protein